MTTGVRSRVGIHMMDLECLLTITERLEARIEAKVDTAMSTGQEVMQPYQKRHRPIWKIWGPNEHQPGTNVS
jgi:hypothetical protein